MKKTLFLLLWFSLTTCTDAQQVLMNLMPQLFSNYPACNSRREYRCTTINNDSMRISRYDTWMIQRNEVKPQDINRLIATFDAEAPHATESTRYMGHFSEGDTLSYTLVYHGHLAKESEEVIDHIGYRSFTAHKGFASLDLTGHQVDMQVMAFQTLPEQTEPFDTLHIDATFRYIASRKGVIATAVQYTGDKGGFAFQRGKGSGWTHGCRLMLPHATQEDFCTIINHMASYFNKRQSLDIILGNRYGVFFIEDIKQIYFVQLDANGCLYYLKARTEGEISIPKRWMQLDYFDGR